MSVNVDYAAIVAMELFGFASFIMAFLFFTQLQRIRKKQREFMNALNRRMISERGDGKCHSSEWVMDNIVYRPKKMLNATPLFIFAVTVLLAFFYYVIGPNVVANVVSFGYTGVIVLFGVALLLWTDAFEAYSYTNAIRRVETDELDKEDQSYLELAREALEKAFLRFVSLGVAFSLLGPFIPQIFNGVVYVFMLYTTVFFKASEMSFKIWTVLGAAIVLILPVLLFFLPELLGRIIIRKGKLLVRKISKGKG